MTRTQSSLFTLLSIMALGVTIQAGTPHIFVNTSGQPVRAKFSYVEFLGTCKPDEAIVNPGKRWIANAKGCCLKRLELWHGSSENKFYFAEGDPVDITISNTYPTTYRSRTGIKRAAPVVWCSDPSLWRFDGKQLYAPGGVTFNGIVD
jgi:hypothetical protein